MKVLIVGLIMVLLISCANDKASKVKDETIQKENGTNNLSESIVHQSHVINKNGGISGTPLDVLKAVVFVPFVAGFAFMMPTTLSYYEAKSISNTKKKYVYYPIVVITAPLFAVGAFLSMPGFMMLF